MTASLETVTDAVGITDAVQALVGRHRSLVNAIGTTNTLGFSQTRAQLDTWRPVLRHDNQLVLVCRTPAGDHDTDLTNMEFWTFQKDGTREKIELTLASTIAVTRSWTEFGHPEWSADNHIVLAAKTASECQLIQIDGSGFGQ